MARFHCVSDLLATCTKSQEGLLARNVTRRRRGTSLEHCSKLHTVIHQTRNIEQITSCLRNLLQRREYELLPQLQGKNIRRDSQIVTTQGCCTSLAACNRLLQTCEKVIIRVLFLSMISVVNKSLQNLATAMAVSPDNEQRCMDSMALPQLLHKAVHGIGACILHQR
eukprot:scpid11987/ scgid23181/ 